MLHYDIGGGSLMKLADAKGREQIISTQSQITANNGDFLLDMAIAGHGIVLTPSFIAWQAVAARDLVAIMQNYCPPQRSAYAVYPQNRYLSRRARECINFLVERFGEYPYWDQFLR